MAQAWKVIIHTHKNAPTEIHKMLLKTNKLSLEDFWSICVQEEKTEEAAALINHWLEITTKAQLKVTKV